MINRLAYDLNTILGFNRKMIKKTSSATFKIHKVCGWPNKNKNKSKRIKERIVKAILMVRVWRERVSRGTHFLGILASRLARLLSLGITFRLPSFSVLSFYAYKFINMNENWYVKFTMNKKKKLTIVVILLP